jgi:hypothetical protein
MCIRDSPWAGCLAVKISKSSDAPFVPDIDSPAFLGLIAAEIVACGGTVDPHFRGNVMALDLLELWRLEDIKDTWLERLAARKAARKPVAARG